MPYHINPSTGRPGVCKAMVSCPYGDLDKDHYDTAADARSAYEEIMKKEEVARAEKKRPREEIVKTLSEAQNKLAANIQALEATERTMSKAFLNHELKEAETARTKVEKLKREQPALKTRVTKLKKELEARTPKQASSDVAPTGSWRGCGGAFGGC